MAIVYAIGLSQNATANDCATGPTPAVCSLLERMVDALRTLSYEGTLVYLHDNRLETLNLLHRVEQGQIHERLISLTGPVRAATRARNRVMCALPDGHPLTIEHQNSRLLDAGRIDPAQLGAHYRLQQIAAVRVAGRETDVIDIVPRDRLRYGYRFYLDRDTALPLKSDLIDTNGEPLAQLMFTSISFQPTAGADDSPPPTIPPAVQTAPVIAKSASRWRFEHPPPGFQLALHRDMPQPAGAVMEHFLFTDHLSAYSIYIEGAVDGLYGATHIGAVHAVGRKVDGYQVTVVGEVPAATVDAALAGVRRLPETSK